MPLAHYLNDYHKEHVLRCEKIDALRKPFESLTKQERRQLQEAALAQAARAQAKARGPSVAVK